MIPKKDVLSFKCNDLFKMANLKAISSSATLIPSVDELKLRLIHYGGLNTSPV